MADIKKIVPVLLNIITAQIILDILKDNKINMIRLKLKLTLGGGGSLENKGSAMLGLGSPGGHPKKNYNDFILSLMCPTAHLCAVFP